MYNEKVEQQTETTHSLSDDDPQMQSTHRVRENNDIGLATNNSSYYFYSSDGSENDMFSNVIYSKTGYIVI